MTQKSIHSMQLLVWLGQGSLTLWEAFQKKGGAAVGHNPKHCSEHEVYRNLVTSQ